MVVVPGALQKDLVAPISLSSAFLCALCALARDLPTRKPEAPIFRHPIILCTGFPFVLFRAKSRRTPRKNRGEIRRRARSGPLSLSSAFLCALCALARDLPTRKPEAPIFRHPIILCTGFPFVLFRAKSRRTPRKNRGEIRRRARSGPLSLSSAFLCALCALGAPRGACNTSWWNSSPANSSFSRKMKGRRGRRRARRSSLNRTSGP